MQPHANSNVRPVSAAAARRQFQLILIKPSHYDDEGYVIRWLRSTIPSNTLAALFGLASEAASRQVLGEEADIVITAIDETNTRVMPAKIIAQMQAAQGFGMVGLIGVQSNQFPRALDIARPLRAAGLQVVIGGFHVSGCLAMLPKMQPDIQKALDLGITIYAGEAEERLDEVLLDAANLRLKPIYNYMKDLPGISETPHPFLPSDRIKKNIGHYTSFDAGRGCPYQCSFCTIINVQGRKSRRRSADDIEQIIRSNVAQGIKRFFITDDNFARNKDWEAILDRVILLRETENWKIRLLIQVDTQCHKIPSFIEKCGKAGVGTVFIGLESISADNLIAAKKRQNKITDYRKMLLMWKAVGAVTYAGFIMGFPADTPESIIRDVEIIKRELPIDLLEFFCLTPLPGSEDHQKLDAKGVWMDPDMNKYDLDHVVTGHPTMSKEVWEATYQKAWATFYTPEHIETVMRRAAACKINVNKVMQSLIFFHHCIIHEDVHPLEGGVIRMKSRRDRRSGMKLENPLLFYPKYAWQLARSNLGWLGMHLRYRKLREKINADPAKLAYRDVALTPVQDDEDQTLEMLTHSAVARAAVAHQRKVERLTAGG